MKNNGNKPPKRNRSDKELWKIKQYYIQQRATEKAEQQATQQLDIPDSFEEKKAFPNMFPFWARLRIEKRRTTLVIDEVTAENKVTHNVEPHFVHREATSVYHKGLEKVEPNPDKERADKGESMYLKSPRKLPKRLFKPHNKDLDMPEHLRQRYDKNNHKDDNDDK